MQLPDRYSRFLIAVLPPPELQAEITAIKQIFGDNYSSKGALKSPPHITLQPPFIWSLDRLSELEQGLADFCRDRVPFSINLSGFAAFPPRVIYLNVLANNHLDLLQEKLSIYCNHHLNIQDKTAQSRPFVPHLTVAFRDLTKPNFHQAWVEFRDRKYIAEWWATEITLLIHNGRKWEVMTSWDLASKYPSLPFI
jgi:2'-5' RNA ligase